MRRTRGLTLVELLVTISIAALLTALAAPSFRRTIQSNSMSSMVNTFISDLRFARSEAIKLGGAVVMCRSNNPEATNPTCRTTAGANGWVSGWFIFQDLDSDGSRQAGERILRVQSATTTLDSIMEPSGSSKFRFTATGRLLNLSSGATSLQFGGGDFSNDMQRVVCVNLSGRARVAGDGLVSCTTDQ